MAGTIDGEDAKTERAQTLAQRLIEVGEIARGAMDEQDSATLARLRRPLDDMDGDAVRIRRHPVADRRKPRFDDPRGDSGEDQQAGRRRDKPGENDRHDGSQVFAGDGGAQSFGRLAGRPPLRRDFERALKDAQGVVAAPGIFQHRAEISERLQVLGVVGERRARSTNESFGSPPR